MIFTPDFLQEQIGGGYSADMLAKKYLNRKQDRSYDLTKVRLRAEAVDLDTAAEDQSVSGVIADQGKVSDLKFVSGPSSWCSRGGLDMACGFTLTSTSPAQLLVLGTHVFLP